MTSPMEILAADDAAEPRISLRPPPGWVRPKRIHNFSVPELGEIYRILHQEYPDLKGRALDTKVLELLDLPISFSYVAHYLELGRQDAVLAILEDETGALGVRRTDRDRYGKPLTGKRRWRREYGGWEKEYDPWDQAEEIDWEKGWDLAWLASIVPAEEPQKKPRARGLFTLKYRGLTAYGTLHGSGFILYKGSEILPIDHVKEEGNESHFYDRLAYAHLIGAGSRLLKNIDFQSSGRAGNFVAGRQMSSRKMWKLDDGRSIADLMP